MPFMPDQQLTAISGGESVTRSLPVLMGALDEVRGHAGVERAVAPAGP
jgi:hypothetical protein